MCVLKMDAHLEIIYLILFLLVFKGPWDAFTRQSDTLEPNLEVCVSEKAGTCMFTWSTPATESKISSPYILLSIREYDVSYRNESKQCFNVSLPEHTGNSSKVTVLTELSPYGGPGSFSWIESKVTHKNPSGKPIILSGNEVYRNGEDDSCNKKDQCLFWPDMRFNVSEDFSGKMCHTKVELYYLGMWKVQLMELWVGTNRAICPGPMRICVLHVDKLHSGRFELQISVTLRNNQICEFSKTVLSSCWEEPLTVLETMSTGTHIAETSTPPPNRVPHGIILFIIGTSVCLTAFITIGVFIYRHYRRNDGQMTNNHTESRVEPEEEYLNASNSTR